MSHPSSSHVPVSNLSQEEWETRIAPHLSTSLQAVSDQIMQTEVVQSWLQSASTEAAEGLGQLSGMQGEMRGYMRMMDDLEEALPNLVAAVEALTESCGAIDLDWRPLRPTSSRLYVDFGRDYSVKVFARLADCTPEAARKQIETVADALPKGEPFPNRPNTVTGLAARNGTGIGVRVKEYLRENRRKDRSVTLLPPNASPLENLSASEAARRLVRLLCSDE